MKYLNLFILFTLLNFSALAQEEIELNVQTITKEEAKEIEIRKSIAETSGEEELIPVNVLTEQDLKDLEEEVLKRHDSSAIDENDDLSYVIYSPDELRN